MAAFCLELRVVTRVPTILKRIHGTKNKIMDFSKIVSTKIFFNNKALYNWIYCFEVLK